ncbi:MAG: glycosyltransferase family 2 protein [Candidatus Omnitrophica bacterium]|nr:glycosyltransferase family 2 protein [Candidatus Omnitrophota bacterium]MDD5653921.1 glycosyltransferase family 2 protein [Candidatus Omnitrophota bacterium]
MRACVIIPTYNESKAIAEVVRKSRHYGLEVVVIDDGSADNTAKIAREAGATVLENQNNQGKGASLIKGFDYALKTGFDYIITMDGDGQHLPEDIPFFLRLANSSDKGIFVGNRMSKVGNMPLVRVITNKFMSWLISLVIGQRVADTQCGFRLIKKEVLQKIKLTTTKYEIESELLIEAARQGFKIESVPVETVYAGEKSQINPFVDTLRFIKFITKQKWISR